MQETVAEYIQYKRDLGFVCKADGSDLRTFAKYADKYASGKPLTIKLALEWSSLPKSGIKRHNSLIGHLRTFAKYLIVEDKRTQLIPKGIYRVTSKRVEPYIYSKDEILLLMNTEVYEPLREFANYTFSTIIGLLSCTGLRIGEAIALKHDDIDWKNGLLNVFDSKNMPRRSVPVDSSVIKQLQRYQRRKTRSFSINTQETFFVADNGNSLSYQNVYFAWKRVREITGIGGKNRRLPRMHDLRHTFACRYLERAYRENKDVDASVHSLSIYLGHSSLRDTYWYLTGVPELMALVGRRCEEHVLKYRQKNKS